MHKDSTLIITLIMFALCYEFTQAIVYIPRNCLRDHFKVEYPSDPVTNYVQVSPAAMQNKHNNNNPNNYKWRYRTVTKSPVFQDIRINDQAKPETYPSYTLSRHAIVNYNDLDVAFNKYRPLQFETISHLQDNNDSSNGLSKRNTNHKLARKSKETAVSSNDHLQKQHLNGYIAPSPPNLGMHPQLHYQIPAIIYNAPTTVPHATGNEPSPMTTESIKNIAHLLLANENENLIRNRVMNYNDNSAEGASNAHLSLPKASSKQHRYAPLRSTFEKELPPYSSTLPYPPSFISITTTEAPSFTFKPLNYKMPDLFNHRQYKSLLDSYIPSWQISKMLQQLKHQCDKNNLQTLAFAKQSKMKLKR